MLTLDVGLPLKGNYLNSIGHDDSVVLTICITLNRATRWRIHYCTAVARRKRRVTASGLKMLHRKQTTCYPFLAMGDISDTFKMWEWGLFGTEIPNLVSETTTECPICSRTILQLTFL
jgi:hypothetical protein